MHIIINAIGSAGDINPFLPVAAKLQKNGHRVDFLASPYFEDKVKRLGLNLLPLGTSEDYLSAVQNPDVWNLEKAFPLVWEMTMKSAEMAYEIIEKNHTAGDTFMIGSSLAIGARLAQEKLGIPLATVHLSPALMLSTYDTPRSATNPLPDWAPRPLKSIWRSATDALMLDPVCRPPLNKLRAQLQLPPVSRIITEWMHSPELVVCAFPEWFAKVQADWPANSFNSSFPLYKPEFDQDLSEELQRFLAAGDAPIVITAGTAMAFAKPIMEMGLKAAEAAGKRAVLVCNFEEQAPLNLPPSAIHVKYANFQLLFQRAAMVIHHGGIGTTAMAFACACPQVIFPFAHDQPDNAMRLERLGVGKMIKDRSKLKDWSEAISAASKPSVRESAARCSELIRTSLAGEDSIVQILSQKMPRLNLA